VGPLICESRAHRRVRYGEFEADANSGLALGWKTQLIWAPKRNSPGADETNRMRQISFTRKAGQTVKNKDGKNGTREGPTQKEWMVFEWAFPREKDLRTDENHKKERSKISIPPWNKAFGEKGRKRDAGPRPLSTHTTLREKGGNKTEGIKAP